MDNSKIDKQHILARLWRYQSERVPLVAIVMMAALTTGALYHFAETSFVRYLASTAIVVLYLIQIRVSDEKKDFDHDNKFYKTRPVQRGLVTLDELYKVGQFAIVMQLLIYASFLDLRIFVLGLLSQGYAFLTRKEFYVRKWLRKHLLTYNLLHQVQIIILFFAVINIIQPTKISYTQLLLFTLINIATVELARKTLPANEDAAKDSYSARLGYKGVAVALIFFAVLAAAFSAYLISQYPRNAIFMILPIVALIPIVNYAYHYAIDPNKRNQKGIENSAILLFVACMLSVILGT
jgi:hypothetical protein